MKKKSQYTFISHPSMYLFLLHLRHPSASGMINIGKTKKEKRKKRINTHLVTMYLGPEQEDGLELEVIFK